jgi:hypothetical protein
MPEGLEIVSAFKELRTLVDFRAKWCDHEDAEAASKAASASCNFRCRAMISDRAQSSQ